MPDYFVFAGPLTLVGPRKKSGVSLVNHSGKRNGRVKRAAGIGYLWCFYFQYVQSRRIAGERRLALAPNGLFFGEPVAAPVIAYGLSLSLDLPRSAIVFF